MNRIMTMITGLAIPAWLVAAALIWDHPWASALRNPDGEVVPAGSTGVNPDGTTWVAERVVSDLTALGWFLLVVAVVGVGLVILQILQRLDSDNGGNRRATGLVRSGNANSITR